MDDFLGKKFNRLTVIEELPYRVNKKIVYKCLCDCGNYVNVVKQSLKNGNTKSCGCYKVDRLLKHNMTHTPLFRVWAGMLDRCKNVKSANFYYYGGRGIKVCSEWDNTNNGFQNFYNWAITNGYKEEKLSNGRNVLTIDRIDVNGNYEPSNCRWVNNKIQQNNTTHNKNITYNGITKNITQWCEFLGITKGKFNWHYNKYGLDKAFKHFGLSLNI